MEVLPYITVYLLLYSFALNFLFWFMPAPYGKFSYIKHKILPFPLIPSYVFSFVVTIGFVTFFIGWFEDGWKYRSDTPSTDRGWLVFISLSIYIAVRVLINFIYLLLL